MTITQLQCMRIRHVIYVREKVPPFLCLLHLCYVTDAPPPVRYRKTLPRVYVFELPLPAAHRQRVGLVGHYLGLREMSCEASPLSFISPRENIPLLEHLLCAGFFFIARLFSRAPISTNE